MRYSKEEVLSRTKSKTRPKLHSTKPAAVLEGLRSTAEPIAPESVDAAGPHPSSPLHRIRRSPAFLLCSAIVLTQLFGPFGRYPPTGLLDSWIYTSYFIDWHDMVRRYGDLYYGTRVPYIAFGALLYKVFAPAAANFLLNATLTWLISYSIFRALRRFFQPIPCLLFALAMSINVALVQPVIWDYPDGPAIAYGFLGLWFCFAPPAWARGLLGVFLGGAFYACSGHTLMIMGLVIVPAVLAQAVWARREGLKRVILELIAIGAGAVSSTILFGFVSVAAGGSFLFFWPQINQARWTLSNGNYSNWQQPVATWLPHAYRLLTPAAVVFLAVFRFFLRGSRKTAGNAIVPAWTVFLLGCAVLYAYFGIVKNALVLQVFYSGVFLLVPTFLFLGFLYCESWQQLNAKQTGRLAVWTVVFLFIVLEAGPYILKQVMAQRIWPFLYLAVLCALVAVGLLLARNRALAASMALSLCLLVVAELPALADTSIAIESFPGAFSKQQSDAYAIALDVRQMISFAGDSRTIRFWFDKDEKDLPLFDSLASLYLWGSPSETGTLIQGTEGQRRQATMPGELLVILSSDPKRIENDRSLLTKYGVRFEQRGMVRVTRGAYNFFVALLAIGAADAKPSTLSMDTLEFHIEVPSTSHVQNRKKSC